MKIRDGTVGRLLYGTAPLLLWAGHWTLMYLLAALHASHAAMLVLTVLAVGGAGALLWHGARRRERALHQLAFAANAVLAAIAIVWTSVPLILLDSGC